MRATKKISARFQFSARALVGHVLLQRTESRESVVAKGARGSPGVLVHVVPAGVLLPERLIALAAVEHAVPENHSTARVHVQIQQRRGASWHGVCLGAGLQKGSHYTCKAIYPSQKII